MTAAASVIAINVLAATAPAQSIATAVAIVNAMNSAIVGQRIAEGRKRLGLSQAQFAAKVNVSPQAVGKWERSESLPDIFMLGRIGEVLGTTDIDYFLGKIPCECSCGCCACCSN